MIPLICGTQSSQIQRDQKENDGCQGLKRRRERVFTGYRVAVLLDEKVTEMDADNDCTIT